MRKIIKRSFLLFLVMVVVLNSGINIVEVKAVTSAQLYEAAYNAVEAAKVNVTQPSINTARKAVNRLKNTTARWAVGEFSIQLDEVQQKLFNRFYYIIYDENRFSRSELSIDDINRAYDMLADFATYEGNKPYMASWSTAVDKYVQQYIDKAAELLKNLESSSNKYYKKALEELLAKLDGIKNKSTLNRWLSQIRSKIRNVSVKQGEKLYIENTVENFGLIVDDNCTIEVEKPTSLDVTYNKKSEEFEVELLEEQGGNFTIKTKKVSIKVAVSLDRDKDIVYTVEKVPYEYIIKNKDYKFVNPSVISIKDSSGKVSEGIEVKLSKKSTYVRVNITASEIDTYNVLIKDDNNLMCNLVVTVDEDGVTKVTIGNLPKAVEKPQTINIDNRLENFGMLITNETDIEIEDPEIVRVTTGSWSSQLSLTSLTPGKTTITITNGDQKAEIIVTVSTKGAITYSIKKFIQQIWDYQDASDITHIGRVSDLQGNASYGVYMSSTNDGMGVCANKEGIYTIVLETRSRGRVYICIKVDRDGHIECYKNFFPLQNNTQTLGEVAANIGTIYSERGYYPGFTVGFGEDKKDILVMYFGDDNSLVYGNYILTMSTSTGTQIKIQVYFYGSQSITYRVINN